MRLSFGVASSAATWMVTSACAPFSSSGGVVDASADVVKAVDASTPSSPDDGSTSMGCTNPALDINDDFESFPGSWTLDQQGGSATKTTQWADLTSGPTGSFVLAGVSLASSGDHIHPAAFYRALASRPVREARLEYAFAAETLAPYTEGLCALGVRNANGNDEVRVYPSASGAPVTLTISASRYFNANSSDVGTSFSVGAAQKHEWHQAAIVLRLSTPTSLDVRVILDGAVAGTMTTLTLPFVQDGLFVNCGVIFMKAPSGAASVVGIDNVRLRVCPR